MDIYYVGFIILLVLIFFSILICAIRRKSYSFKTVWAENDRNIEAKLRIFMRKNPRSEIVVINNSPSSETGKILKKMQYDFPEIHIVSYEQSGFTAPPVGGGALSLCSRPCAFPTKGRKICTGIK